MVLHRPFEPARVIGKVKSSEIHMDGLRVNQATGFALLNGGPYLIIPY